MPTKAKKVLIIDSVNQTVTEGTVSSLRDMQNLVGGLIERGWIFNNCDEVYVNEEGLFGQPKHFFHIAGCHQPFAGNAFIIGSVTVSGKNKDVKSSIEEIQKQITFLDREQAIKLL